MADIPPPPFCQHYVESRLAAVPPSTAPATGQEAAGRSRRRGGEGGDGARTQRFVECHNPAQAERDAAVRANPVKHLRGLIGGSDGSSDRGIYDGDLAHARARDRTRRPRRPLLSREPQLRRIVQDKLELEWSPAQIAAHLRETYPDRPAWHLCHETIYQGLYHGGKGGLSGTLTKKLRTARPLRKRRRSSVARTPRFVAPGRLIHQRPAVVEHRARIGDWEGDLIVGRMSRSAIGTLVDRRTGVLRLVHLPNGHGAEQLRVAMLPVLTGLPALARQTLTWDQGSEMARHDLLTEYFADGIFFAHPDSPWLRGTNENTNGLLRQYFTKGSDLRALPRRSTDGQEASQRPPRKRLGWRSPAQVMTAELTS